MVEEVLIDPVYTLLHHEKLCLLHLHLDEFVVHLVAVIMGKWTSPLHWEMEHEHVHLQHVLAPVVGPPSQYFLLIQVIMCLIDLGWVQSVGVVGVVGHLKSIHLKLVGVVVEMTVVSELEFFLLHCEERVGVVIRMDTGDF